MATQVALQLVALFYFVTDSPDDSKEDFAEVSMTNQSNLTIVGTQFQISIQLEATVDDYDPCLHSTASDLLTHIFSHRSSHTDTCVSGWRCAKYENYFSQQPDYIDCLWDCCGNSFNRHCCAPIGIIVGCCIVGAILVAALTVLLICWWQRRRAKQSQGPRLFHNQRHSHYPVAPSSVTRPAPMMAFTVPDSDQEFKQPPENEYGAPPRTGYRPGPPQGYRPSPRLEKPPLEEYYSDRPPQSYRPGPPRQQYPPSMTSEKVSLGSHSGERAVDI